MNPTFLMSTLPNYYLPVIAENDKDGQTFSTHHQKRSKKSNRILMKKRIKLRHKQNKK